MSFDKCIFFGLYPKVQKNLLSTIQLRKPSTSWVRSTFNSPGALPQTGLITFCCMLAVPCVRSAQLQTGGQKEIRLCGEEQGAVSCQANASASVGAAYADFCKDKPMWHRVDICRYCDRGRHFHVHNIFHHNRGPRLWKTCSKTSLSACVICFLYGCHSKLSKSSSLITLI